MKKLYTKEQLLKKYKDVYINVYAHHFDKWDNKLNKYITLYEITEISKEIKENCNLPSDLFNY